MRLLEECFTDGRTEDNCLVVLEPLIDSAFGTRLKNSMILIK
jgi:hypothetical protein